MNYLVYTNDPAVKRSLMSFLADEDGVTFTKSDNLGDLMRRRRGVGRRMMEIDMPESVSTQIVRNRQGTRAVSIVRTRNSIRMNSVHVVRNANGEEQEFRESHIGFHRQQRPSNLRNVNSPYYGKDSQAPATPFAPTITSTPLTTNDDYHPHNDNTSYKIREVRTRKRKVAAKPIGTITIDDDDSDCEIIAPPKSAKSAVDSSKNDVDMRDCKKCGVMVANWHNRKTEHALTHCNLGRFKCNVANCQHRAATQSLVVKHHEKEHGDEEMNIKIQELSASEKQQLKEVRMECFPDRRLSCRVKKSGSVVKKRKTLNKKFHFECQVCHRKFETHCARNGFMKKRHALTHVDMMMFKCMRNGCEFESKTAAGMRGHENSMHGNLTDKEETRISLTDDQELEISKMYTTCFPNEDDDIIIDDNNDANEEGEDIPVVEIE